MASFAARSLQALLAVSLIMPNANPAWAQVTTGPDGRTVTPRDTANPSHHRTLFTMRDAYLALGFTGLTIAMFPLDQHLAKEFQRESLRNNKLFNNPARGVELITSPGAFIIGGGLYVGGKLSHNENLTDLGWHGTESVLLATGITTVLKGALGRTRPYVSRDTNAHDFQFMRGFTGNGASNYEVPGGQKFGKGDFQSFPSGHTTTAFAAASSVTSEVRRMWPRSLWYVAPVMYGGATLVGLSRMYHNNHWASDVVLGAAIGTFSGLKVVRYSHAHPDNKLDHFILGASIVPDGHGGGTLSFSLPAP